MSIELKAPLVSIVITSYNYAKYIRDALESVSAQTYRPLECIVVDDCSTDNSIEVINQTIGELQRKNDGISYSIVSLEKNSGQLAAFQLGIEKAKGVFINFLDADDFLLPDFVSTHIQVHLESCVAFTFSEPMGIDSEGQIHCFVHDRPTHVRLNQALGLLNRTNRPVASFEHWSRNLQSCAAAQNFITSQKYVLNRYHISWNLWYWYPTSSAVFRKSSLRYLSKADPEKWRICADTLLFCFSNIIGNSSVIPFQLSTYRRHGDNGFGGDVIVGAYIYMSERSRKRGDVNSNQLPLSLLQIFSQFEDPYSLFSMEFMKTVIYHAGAGFLRKNWDEVFSYLPMPHFHQRLMLLLKTIARHAQLNRRLKREASLKRRSILKE